MNRRPRNSSRSSRPPGRSSNGGKTITFQLRDGLRFSDGTPFSADDVAYTMQQLMDPALHSPTGDAFRSGEGKVETAGSTARTASASPSRRPSLAWTELFDQVAIMSAKSPQKEMAVLGPYYVAENKAGSYLILKRNPNYWKHDPAGRTLPYIDSVRLDIQQNRDIEMLRLTRGEIHLINSLDAEYFDKARCSGSNHGARCRRVAGFRADVVQPGRQLAAAGLQESLVHLHELPARDLGSHQPRGYLPDRVPRTRAARGRAGLARQQILVQRQAATASL